MAIVVPAPPHQMQQLNRESTMIFLLTMSMMLVVTNALVVTPAASEQQLPIMSKGAFTSSKYDAIRDLYISQLERIDDNREADSVSRINRFDNKGKLLQNGDLDWIMDRVATHLPTTATTTSSGGIVATVMMMIQATSQNNSRMSPMQEGAKCLVGVRKKRSHTSAPH